MIFVMLLRDEKDTASAMGSNLLGAVLGGFLEYASMVTGLNALYLIAFLCYFAAMIFWVKRQ